MDIFGGAEVCVFHKDECVAPQETISLRCGLCYMSSLLQMYGDRSL